jgi:hypothetical protein
MGICINVRNTMSNCSHIWTYPGVIYWSVRTGTVRVCPRDVTRNSLKGMGNFSPLWPVWRLLHRQWTNGRVQELDHMGGSEREDAWPCMHDMRTDCPRTTTTLEGGSSGNRSDLLYVMREQFPSFSHFDFDWYSFDFLGDERLACEMLWVQVHHQPSTPNAKPMHPRNTKDLSLVASQQALQVDQWHGELGRERL